VILAPRPEWRAKAACKGMTDLFFPAKQEDVDAPKAICHTCPVERQCLAWALAHGEKFGIWGGVSERGRRRMRGWDADQYVSH